MGKREAVAVGRSGWGFTRRHIGRVEQTTPPGAGKGNNTGTARLRKAVENLILGTPVRSIVAEMEDIKMLVLLKFWEEGALVARYGQGTDHTIILKLMAMFDKA
jgi:hypothetical protein